ncbi:terminase family protein [Pseudomonas sp. RTB3]|nr:terminase family protein [Pseudomonas sp. RTB3]
MQLNLPNIRIVYYWIRQGGWEDMLSDEEPLTAVGRRITLLLDKVGSLSKDDLNELDRLTIVRERLLKQAAKPAPVAASNGDDMGEPQEPRRRPRGERSSRGEGGDRKKEKKAKNDISGLTEVDFLDKFISKMYRYQQELFAAKQNPLTSRIRNILKSRQVGLTYYFAGEAFMDAVLTGDNQVFLSASRSQSEIFRSYIIQFAKQWFDIELTGNPITLSNGAELRFLSTNSSTAQGYHGHVYVDEYFWIRDFEKLSTVASAMGTHKKWRKTYFSTPSAVSHQAYPFWSGRNSATASAARKPAAPGPPRRPTRRARCAQMVNGARPSPFRTRSMAGAICSTWSSCSWSTTKTNSSSCFTASSSTAAKARSVSRIWSGAIPTCRCGRTTTRSWIDLSATVRCGLATIRAAPATTPHAWWLPRRWNPGRNSASWKSTAGGDIRSTTRPPRSKS